MKVTNPAHGTWLEGKPLEGAIYWGRDLTDLHRQIFPEFSAMRRMVQENSPVRPSTSSGRTERVRHGFSPKRDFATDGRRWARMFSRFYPCNPWLLFFDPRQSVAPDFDPRDPWLRMGAAD